MWYSLSGHAECSGHASWTAPYTASVLAILGFVLVVGSQQTHHSAGIQVDSLWGDWLAPHGQEGACGVV